MQSPAGKLASDRAYYTSLVGVGLLADSELTTSPVQACLSVWLCVFCYAVLPDLPLPTYTPTALEQTVLGHSKLGSENGALLKSTNSDLCAQMRAALASVDTSFM